MNLFEKATMKFRPRADADIPYSDNDFCDYLLCQVRGFLFELWEQPVSFFLSVGALDRTALA